MFKDSKISEAEILALCEKKSFLKGDIIYSAESYKKALGIVISGYAVALSQNKTELSYFEKGKMFGGAALFGSENFVTEIKAVKDTDVAFIYEKDLTDIFAKYPEIAVNYIKYLSLKIRFLNTKIEIFSSDDVKARVYNYLCSIAVNGKIEKPNMSKISNNLNIGRTSLYRVLNDLNQKGLTEKINGNIIIRSK